MMWLQICMRASKNHFRLQIKSRKCCIVNQRSVALGAGDSKLTTAKRHRQRGRTHQLSRHAEQPYKKHLRTSTFWERSLREKFIRLFNNSYSGIEIRKHKSSSDLLKSSVLGICWKWRILWQTKSCEFRIECHNHLAARLTNHLYKITIALEHTIAKITPPSSLVVRVL